MLILYIKILFKYIAFFTIVPESSFKMILYCSDLLFLLKINILHEIFNEIDMTASSLLLHDYNFKYIKEFL